VESPRETEAWHSTNKGHRDSHGMDGVRMTLERFFGFTCRQVPNAQRLVEGAGDHVTTIGCECHGIDSSRMALERTNKGGVEKQAYFPPVRGIRLKSSLNREGS
jgi:hypothetical protein